MSIKTTHQCTRKVALQTIMVKLHECSDEQLSSILEEVVHNGFYNFHVVDNECRLDDDCNIIRSVCDMPEPNDAF